MRIKISVIIPVYKVEKYLYQCVDSVIQQTYKNIEVILVDDGSPDNCPHICDEYAKSDERVKVIHKVNGGLSDARNVGLDVAEGEYVVFVDSDDYWRDSFVLEALIKMIEQNRMLDFINFNCQYYYQNDNVFRLWPKFPDSVVTAQDMKSIIVGLIGAGQFPMSACMKLIRRDVLISNNIKFIDGITSEDIPWFLDLMLKCKRCVFINEYFYIYRKQVTGTISSSFSEKKYNDLFSILERESENLKNSHLDSETESALLSFVAYEFCILLGLVNNFRGSDRDKYLSELLEYEWLLQYDLNPKVKLVRCVKMFLGAHLTSFVLFQYIKRVVNRN